MPSQRLVERRVGELDESLLSNLRYLLSAIYGAIAACRALAVCHILLVACPAFASQPRLRIVPWITLVYVRTNVCIDTSTVMYS